MGVMVMMMMAADRLRQILDAGELAALGGARKIGGELVELGRRRGIAGRRRGLSGALQVGGDLLGNLRVLGRVRLLKLLEFSQHLRERRKPAVVRRLSDR